MELRVRMWVGVGVGVEVGVEVGVRSSLELRGTSIARLVITAHAFEPRYPPP